MYQYHYYITYRSITKNVSGINLYKYSSTDTDSHTNLVIHSRKETSLILHYIDWPWTTKFSMSIPTFVSSLLLACTRLRNCKAYCILATNPSPCLPSRIHSSWIESKWIYIPEYIEATKTITNILKWSLLSLRSATESVGACVRRIYE